MFGFKNEILTVVVLLKQKTYAKFVLKYNEDCCVFGGMLIDYY